MGQFWMHFALLQDFSQNEVDLSKNYKISHTAIRHHIIQMKMIHLTDRPNCILFNQLTTPIFKAMKSKSAQELLNILSHFTGESKVVIQQHYKWDN